MRYQINCTAWPRDVRLIVKRRKDAALNTLWAVIYDQLGAYGLRDTKHAWNVKASFDKLCREIEPQKRTPTNGRAWTYGVEITDGCVVSFHGMREP